MGALGATAREVTGQDLLKAVIVASGAALWVLGCADPLVISDYGAGAVIRGTVRLESGEPVVGASVRVDVDPPRCEQDPAELTGGGVFTDAEGRFEGEFSFLSGGPVVAECVGIVIVDTLTSALVGDTVIPGPLRFDGVRSDTLEVELRF